MSEPVRIVVTLEGGLVQSVCTLGVPVEVVIIDYDTDGSDADCISEIDQGDNKVADAHVYSMDAGQLDNHVMKSIEEYWSR